MGERGGLRDDLQAINRVLQHWAGIWERNLDNNFAMEQLKDHKEERLQAKAVLQQHLLDHPVLAHQKPTLLHVDVGDSSVTSWKHKKLQNVNSLSKFVFAKAFVGNVLKTLTQLVVGGSVLNDLS